VLITSFGGDCSKLVEARVDPVAAHLKRQCQHFVGMFLTVMAVTDKGARYGRATAQAVAEVIWNAVTEVFGWDVVGKRIADYLAIPLSCPRNNSIGLTACRHHGAPPRH